MIEQTRLQEQTATTTQNMHHQDSPPARSPPRDTVARAPPRNRVALSNHLSIGGHSYPVPESADYSLHIADGFFLHTGEDYTPPKSDITQIFAKLEPLDPVEYINTVSNFRYIYR